MFDARLASFTVSIALAIWNCPVAWSHQEPSLGHRAGRPQSLPSGPRLPLVLQKAKTAHLASKLTLFTSGFLYSFFLFFSKAFPYKYSVEPVEVSLQLSAISCQQKISSLQCPVGASFACDFNAFDDFNFFPCALRLAPYALCPFSYLSWSDPISFINPFSHHEVPCQLT